MGFDRRWLRLVPFLFLAAGLAYINYQADPAGIFHNCSRQVGEALLDGREAYFYSGEGDERIVKAAMMEGMPDQVDCVVAGGSTVLGIRSGQSGTDSFYNLGLSGSDFYDIYAQFGMMDLLDIKTDRLIICVDPALFDPELYNRNPRHEKLRPYSEYMFSVLSGDEESRKGAVARLDSDAYDKKKWRQLFSLTYFQASMDEIRSNQGLPDTKERWAYVDENYAGDVFYYKPDGSIVYPPAYQNLDEAHVKKHAGLYEMDSALGKDRPIGSYEKDMFERMLEYYERRGTRIQLFLCPLAPSLWDRMQRDGGEFIVYDIGSYIREISERHGIRQIGSFNPYEVGIRDEDFYDSRHVRHEVLEKYFDFKS